MRIAAVRIVAGPDESGQYIAAVDFTRALTAAEVMTLSQRYCMLVVAEAGLAIAPGCVEPYPSTPECFYTNFGWLPGSQGTSGSSPLGQMWQWSPADPGSGVDAPPDFFDGQQTGVIT